MDKNQMNMLRCLGILIVGFILAGVIFSGVPMTVNTGPPGNGSYINIGAIIASTAFFTLMIAGSALGIVYFYRKTANKSN